MGNPEHMKIILEGDVDTWNTWRNSNLRVQPDLTRIDLSGRDLPGIDFRGVGLFKANLSNCNLSKAVLRQAIAIKTDFRNANLSGAYIYGISAWDNQTDGATQKDLVVTEPHEPIITVDSIQIAQFIHLLMVVMQSNAKAVSYKCQTI
jgi:Pentapeptide repeats (8 copies)